MRDAPLNAVAELFGHSADSRQEADWSSAVRDQECPYLGKRCYKVRKSEPGTSIGSCTVFHGKAREPVVICPARFLERRQLFVDCLHLLAQHEPGNEFHVVPEVSIPGGSVDYMLASVRQRKVKDFVGIEIQTLDTTGTVWPERQRLLRKVGALAEEQELPPAKPFGMNWKMTAKTILVQIHHKIQTFEHLDKKLVLVLQDQLFGYMAREFAFEHLRKPALLGDSLHLHAYQLGRQVDGSFRLGLQSRLGTDAAGIAVCLGLRAETRVGLGEILATLEAKLSPSTLFAPV